ncbi:hypothetical protein [Lactiplantibacillus plantarum]|uniref:hypothetical protein n=1 Tax=Lactiplantibacillus plantarum TaxID=1590 RepID=UPI00223F67E8|nr:hypothetical protein [Lactiplantibacillus plantarum]
MKQAGQLSSTSNSSSSTATSSSSSSTTTKTVSAADKKEAEQMRTNIVQSDPDSWDSAALAQVPDSVIVAATKKSNDMGGDPGTTANMIAEQYPNIKKNGSSDSDMDDSANGLSASEAKNKLNSFEFYIKNKSHIELTGQEQTSDGWEFTYSFVGGSTGGVLVVNNDGKIADKTFSGIEGETGSWK